MNRQLISTRSWQYRAWIAALVTLAVVLSAGIGLVWQARTSGNRYADETMRAYAAQLRESAPDALRELVEDDGAPEGHLYRENIDVILYTRRPDGTAGLYTANTYLRNHPSELPSTFGATLDERIGDYAYKTYTFVCNDGSYVKLLMQADLLGGYESDTGFLWFFPLTIVLTMGIYTAFAFLMGRPVVRAIKQQKEFIHEMTHEIRTPLTVIRGNVEHMLACPDHTVMQVSELLDNTLEEVDHITALSQDLMSSVSTPSPKRGKSADLSDTVSGVLEIYSEIIGESNRTLIANVQSAQSSLDGEKVKQLLIILLENAVKYTREGDKIRVSLKKTDSGALLTVADTGIGIADGDEHKIFDRFYRGENAKNQQGTGLGLAIARNIVEEAGGKIQAMHNVPSGLVVTVLLPERV